MAQVQIHLYAITAAPPMDVWAVALLTPGGYDEARTLAWRWWRQKDAGSWRS